MYFRDVNEMIEEVKVDFKNKTGHELTDMEISYDTTIYSFPQTCRRGRPAEEQPRPFPPVSGSSPPLPVPESSPGVLSQRPCASQVPQVYQLLNY